MSAPSLQTRVLHHLGDSPTIDALAEDLAMPRQALVMAVVALMRRDLVERRSNGAFRLTRAGKRAAADGIEIVAIPDASGKPDGDASGKPDGDTSVTVRWSPVRDTLRQRAWTAMRMSRTFSVPDILVPAASGEEKDPRGNLQRYCKGLCDAGVLRRLARFQQGLACGGPVYRLARDLGPIAPTLRSGSNRLHDPNAHEEPAHV